MVLRVPIVSNKLIDLANCITVPWQQLLSAITASINNIATVVSTAALNIIITNTASDTTGRAVLIGGTKVVLSTSVTATSNILLTANIPGGTPGFLYISARNPGVSFTILSSNGADTSTVAWLILEPITT